MEGNHQRFGVGGNEFSFLDIQVFIRHSTLNSYLIQQGRGYRVFLLQMWFEKMTGVLTQPLSTKVRLPSCWVSSSAPCKGIIGTYAMLLELASEPARLLSPPFVRKWRTYLRNFWACVPSGRQPLFLEVNSQEQGFSLPKHTAVRLKYAILLPRGWYPCSSIRGSCNLD